MTGAPRPSPELLEIEEAARRFLAREYDFQRRRRLLEAPHSHDPQPWRDFAEMGWLGLPLPERFGGSGGGAREAWMLLRCLGAHLVLEPYLSSVLVCGWSLVRHAAGHAQTRIIPGLVAGHLRLAFAHDEPGHEDPDRPATAATPADGGWRVAGHKAVVLGAPTADCILVSAGHDGRRLVFLLDPNDERVTIRPYPLIDGRQAGEVAIDGAVLPPAALIARDRDADGLLETARLAGALGSMAEAAGVMDAALAATVDHLRTRRQFGQRLADFQALRHRVADMHIACQEADALGWRAAQALDSADSVHGLLAVAAAKAQIGEAARKVCEEAVQMHGAIAITDEFPVGHYLKRAIVNERLFGNSEHWNERFSKASFMS